MIKLALTSGHYMSREIFLMIKLFKKVDYVIILKMIDWMIIWFFILKYIYLKVLIKKKNL